jgi:hypothetical protein
MRFAIMHKTNAYWEGGALPSQALIARVGAMLQRLSDEGRLRGAEGLRPSALGVRLTFESGRATVRRGPFDGDHELPSGFSIVRSTLEEAIEWAIRRADVAGDTTVDIRPLTEPWELGLQPAPDDPNRRRYMVLAKATADTEVGDAPTATQRAGLANLILATHAPAIHVQTESMRPSSRGRRYVNAPDGISIMDGPFAETKELLGGFIILAADSLDDAGRFAAEYMRTVGADEVDVRELED